MSTFIFVVKKFSMKISKTLIFLIVVALGLFLAWKGFKSWKLQEQEKHNQLQLNELRGAAKLVIWEQTFTLHNTETISNQYFKIFKTEEKISSSINGKIGFHIDLADSIHTKFSRKGDTIFIDAPLQNTYIEMDLGSLQQIKESSLDPSLELKKEEVVKNLRLKAAQEFIPNIQSHLKEKDLKYQESKLSQLVGSPVKINITAYPKENQLHWR